MLKKNENEMTETDPRNNHDVDMQDVKAVTMLMRAHDTERSSSIKTVAIEQPVYQRTHHDRKPTETFVLQESAEDDPSTSVYPATEAVMRKSAGVQMASQMGLTGGIPARDADK